MAENDVSDIDMETMFMPFLHCDICIIYVSFEFI